VSLQDHLNDVMSNAMAIVTAAVASNARPVWWLDPAGAIGISLYIVWRWGAVTKGQVGDQADGKPVTLAA
jgi:divalent metal cation (Fe/Co/Zn/Cd) transporter